MSYPHKWQSYRDHRLCDVTSVFTPVYTGFSVVGGLEKAGGIVERHRLDVERAQDRLLVDEVRVVGVGVARRQDDAHLAHVDVHGAQVGTVQWRPLAYQSTTHA